MAEVCGFASVCGRPAGHRGHHGGWRAISPDQLAPPAGFVDIQDPSGRWLRIPVIDHRCAAPQLDQTGVWLREADDLITGRSTPASPRAYPGLSRTAAARMRLAHEDAPTFDAETVRELVATIDHIIDAWTLGTRILGAVGEGVGS